MAIVVALITCFVVIPLAGLAVDLGMQRVARGDMQTVADLVAIDMARVLGSGGTPTVAMATASAARNVGAVGSTPTLQVFLGYIDSASTFKSSQSRGCGRSPYGTYFTTVPSGKSANAVVVTASNSVKFAINPGSGDACRSALAQVSSTACFAMGSYAAAVRGGDSAVLAPLNGIFGLNASLLSYQNVAGASVTLAQLAANTRFGTATQLLTGSVRVSDLVLAAIDVLGAQAPTNTAAINALNGMVSVTSALPAINLANLLHVSPGDSAALATRFNVLDLIAGAVLLADGSHAISIPNVWANVAGTGHTADIGLYIQQGAATACGAPNTSQASANNSQVSGYVNFDQMNTPSFNTAVGNLKTGSATGQFTISAAPAHAQLVSPPAVVCGAGTAASPTTFSVQVSSSLASASLNVKLPVSGSVTVLGLGLVNLNLVANVSVVTTKPAGSTTVNLSIPPNDTTPISTGSSIRLNSATTSVVIDPTSSATLLGLPLPLTNTLLVPVLNAVLDSVTTIFVPKTITPLVSNLNALVTGPLNELLGVDIGGADVFALGATCGNPALGG